MNRAIDIAGFSADEIPKIKQKFLDADYPHRFINSIINNFQEISLSLRNYVFLFVIM